MIEIRDVRIEDAEEILAILNPIIAARCYTAMDTEFTIEQERHFIRTFPPRGIFLAANDTVSNRIVGFQNVSPFADFTRAFDHVGVIGTYVDLDLRRQGIATQLFAATYDAARQKGYEKFFSYVRADNDAALQTYLRQGFRIVGKAERQAKIDGRYVDEIVIERAI
ncbi:MAG TPA: GNAT family N-acetyltransferase [Vicinamibacterales bacterium]|nr:GNAT family N-acetyltransferase [Vicinamibacterales bacterium]